VIVEAAWSVVTDRGWVGFCCEGNAIYHGDSHPRISSVEVPSQQFQTKFSHRTSRFPVNRKNPALASGQELIFQMSPQPQLEPNKSTGPRTDAGKAVSSQNSLRHGLASGTVVIPGEDPEFFQAFAASFKKDYARPTPSKKSWSPTWPATTGSKTAPCVFKTRA